MPREHCYDHGAYEQNTRKPEKRTRRAMAKDLAMPIKPDVGKETAAVIVEIQSLA